jgi:hypothetical protein
VPNLKPTQHRLVLIQGFARLQVRQQGEFNLGIKVNDLVKKCDGIERKNRLDDTDFHGLEASFPWAVSDFCKTKNAEVGRNFRQGEVA